MNKEEFNNALLYGFGSAVIFAKNNDISAEFEELIYDYAIHNYKFDTQCEGDRARYLWDIIKECPNVRALQERIMQNLKLNDAGIYYDQLYYLGVLFCNESDYNPVQCMMDNYRYHESEDGFIGEEELVELLGDEGILFVSKAIALRLNSNETYDGEYFWVGFLEDEFGIEHAKNVLSELLSSDDKFKEYFELSLERKEGYKRKTFVRGSYEDVKQSLKEQRFNKMRPWGKKATKEEIEKALFDIKNSTDLELVSKLMHVFVYREYEGDVDSVINFLDQSEYELSSSVVEMLKWKKDDRVHYKAQQLIMDRLDWYEYLPLLHRNMDESDIILIISKLHNEYDDFEWHTIQLYINDLLELNTNGKHFELYELLYRNGRCTVCREELIGYMLRDGFNDNYIVDEARFDVNLDIRVKIG